MCPFKLIVKVDRNGYYLVEGSSCSTHCYHMNSIAKGNNNATKLISPEDLKVCQMLWAACTTSTIGKTLLHS